jgi:hypothetical protein
MEPDQDFITDYYGNKEYVGPDAYGHFHNPNKQLSIATYKNNVTSSIIDDLIYDNDPENVYEIDGKSISMDRKSTFDIPSPLRPNIPEPDYRLLEVNTKHLDSTFKPEHQELHYDTPKTLVLQSNGKICVLESKSIPQELDSKCLNPTPSFKSEQVLKSFNPDTYIRHELNGDYYCDTVSTSVDSDNF